MSAASTIAKTCRTLIGGVRPSGSVAPTERERPTTTSSGGSGATAERFRPKAAMAYPLVSVSRPVSAPPRPVAPKPLTTTRSLQINRRRAMPMGVPLRGDFGRPTDEPIIRGQQGSGGYVTPSLSRGLNWQAKTPASLTSNPSPSSPSLPPPSGMSTSTPYAVGTAQQTQPAPAYTTPPPYPAAPGLFAGPATKARSGSAHRALCKSNGPSARVCSAHWIGIRLGK